MVVCPQCGYPKEENALVIGERDVTCKMCAWHGSSSELLEFEDESKFQDPRKLQEFMGFLQKHISPLVGKELANLELISRDPSPDNIAFITKLLVDYSRAGFGAVLKGLLLGPKEETTVH
mgnify:CR=1 FL=1